MADRHSRTRAFAIPQVAPDIRTFAGLAAAAIAVLATGAGIAAILPDAVSPWLSISAFGAPAALALMAYWWVDQRR